MKIKIIYKLGLISFLSLTLFNCESDVDDLNQNPNTFQDVPGELEIGTAILSSVKLAGSDAARFSSVFSGQATGAQNQWVSTNRYDVTADSFSDMWDDAYQEGVAQAKEAKTKARSTGNPPLEGTALVFEAIHLGELTTLFGDIPDSEAGYFPIISDPVYDAQVTVFSSIQSKLDSALLLLSGKNVFGNETSPYLSKILEGGGTWDEVIHSLKARYYYNANDYTNALTEAKDGLSSSSNDLKSIQQNINGARNYWNEFGTRQRPENIIAEGSYLYKMLDTTDTSVSRQLLTINDTLRFNKYYSEGDFNYGTGGIFGAVTPIPIISWYEVKLIEAESAYRTGDEASALAALNEVRAGLTTEYGNDFPASSASGSALLTDILEERYITLAFTNQVFNDVQRTNNGVGITPNNGTQLPMRFLIPQSEINNNSNVPTTRPDLFTTTPVNQ